MNGNILNTVLVEKVRHKRKNFQEERKSRKKYTGTLFSVNVLGEKINK